MPALFQGQIAYEQDMDDHVGCIGAVFRLL